MTATLPEIPLFPLPLGAILPGELLPLHIFEPRYRLMMEEVRRGEAVIAIATLVPGPGSDASGRPLVAPVVGLGRMVKDRRNADGTSDIVLHGVVRGEILDEIEGKPWRRARLLVGGGDEPHAAELFRVRRLLLEGLAGRLRTQKLSWDLTRCFDPGALADRIAAALDLPAGQRCELMAALDPETRCRRLLSVLEDRRHRQAVLELIPSLHAFSLSMRP